MPWWWDERTQLSAQARVALTLSRLGQGDPGFNSRLYQQRQQLSLTARGELMETLARTSGADSRTAELTRDLQGAVSVVATFARLRDQDDWSALWDGEMSSTASALIAWLVADPKNPLLPRLARGLVASREGVLKSYCGMSIAWPCLSRRSCCTSKSVSSESGWS